MTSMLHSRKRGLLLNERKDSSIDAHSIGVSKGFKWRDISKAIRWLFAALTLLVVILLLWRGLQRHWKVMWHVVLHPWAHGSFLVRGEVRDGFQHHFYHKSPRFVVVVDSGSEVNPDNRHNRLESIHATWGPSSRAIFVVNNVTEYPKASHAVISRDSQPRDPYSYPQLLLLPPDALPDRSVASLKYIIQTVLEQVDPDFALFTNCHTYIIPDHVCHFLKDIAPSDGMYAGHALKVNNASFHPESAGYILSRRSMRNLVSKWKENDPICIDPKESHPGFFVSKCLSQVFGIAAQDTRQDGKYHQFHSFPLMRLVTGDIDQWYLDLSEHENLFGDDCCSDNTVSFHYVEHLESRALFATRKALLDNPDMADEELKAMMIQLWPVNVGGYSRRLPDATSKVWPTLLRVMRKVSTLHSKSSIRCL